MGWIEFPLFLLHSLHQSQMRLVKILFLDSFIILAFAFNYHLCHFNFASGFANYKACRTWWISCLMMRPKIVYYCVLCHSVACKGCFWGILHNTEGVHLREGLTHPRFVRFGAVKFILWGNYCRGQKRLRSLMHFWYQKRHCSLLSQKANPIFGTNKCAPNAWELGFGRPWGPFQLYVLN